MAENNVSSFKIQILSIILAAQAIALLVPLSAHSSSYIGDYTAVMARDSIFIMDRDRTKIVMLYRAETMADAPAYGQIVNIIEPYQRHGLQLLPFAVAQYGGEAAQFLTFAPGWDLHNRLSYQEFQILSADMKVRGLDVGEIKELPFIVLIAPNGRIVGQWKGTENLIKIHEALTSLGYAGEKSNGNTISAGRDFVRKTQPIYQKKITVDENEQRLISKHFVDSGLMDSQMRPYGGTTSLFKLSAEMRQEPSFLADTAGGSRTCGNYYILEVTNSYNIYKHLYCISGDEAKLISSHSKKTDQMEKFVDDLYQKGERSLSKQHIMSQGERSNFGFDVLAFFAALPDKQFDKKSLVSEINDIIKQSGRMIVIGGLLRQR